jgi:TM2 domain-containing membrane protein YozV
MSDMRMDRPRFCAHCGAPVVVADANFCKQCGAPLTWLSHNISWRPMLAMLLSVIPGLGQLYKGQPGRGLLWFMLVIVFLVYATPIGLLLWIVCAGNAALGGAVREDVIAHSVQHRTQPHGRDPRRTAQRPVS